MLDKVQRMKFLGFFLKVFILENVKGLKEMIREEKKKLAEERKLKE
jgi:site-specific DNA-cytosine methylase